LWVIFALLEPDPDPNPKHCYLIVLGSCYLIDSVPVPVLVCLWITVLPVFIVNVKTVMYRTDVTTKIITVLV
jgi:hypothetical protein